LDWKNEGYFIRKLTFLILILLIFPTVVEGATFNFTVQTNTALNFENGSYIVEVIEIYRPMYVKVNMTSSGVSKINTLFDGEPTTLNEIKLTSSSITGTTAVIMIELPAGWGPPKQYQVVRPVMAPNIVLTKSVDKTNVNVGDLLEFKIIVENIGNATARNLTLLEPLSKGFTIGAGRMPYVINAELAAGANQEFYYTLKAVEPGTFKIDPTTVSYGSKTSTSNSLTITVGAETKEKSNLTTVITVDKNNVYTDDSIKATVKITNTGKAPAKSVLVDGTPPLSMEVIEGDLRQVYDIIPPMESKEYRVGLKAIETGNYSIHLRTTYNDDAIGTPSDSETITVTQKERNYLYILVPIIIIITGIVLFTIKRHKEYSY
ncbi:MAG: BatD family protein, partial [Candidatus Methanoperedens sp.]|nr:BatD family protein [Candidatus Methanoperedens sp.]